MSAAWSGNATGDAVRMLLQTFAILGRRINNFALRDADIVRPPLLAGVTAADFAARKKSIQSSRQTMLAQLSDLRARPLAKSH